MAEKLKKSGRFSEGTNFGSAGVAGVAGVADETLSAIVSCNWFAQWQNTAATGALANGRNGPERCTVYGMCRMFFGIFLAHSFFFTIFASSTGTLHDAAFRGGGALSRTPATLHVLLTF